MYEKLIEIFTTSTFYLKFKENNENDMTFFYCSCLGRYCFQPMSADACLAGPDHLQLLTLASLVQTICFPSDAVAQWCMKVQQKFHTSSIVRALVNLICQVVG